MDTTTCRGVKITPLSPDIPDFRFETVSGSFGDLEAGAHVAIRLRDNLSPQYSIRDRSPSGKWLSVAVWREDNGRGGSPATHALAEGTQIEVGGPRNNFRPDDSGMLVTQIAGGIGATPICAMARELRNRDVDFRVFYLVRTLGMAAFHPLFQALGLKDRYQLHCDDTDGFADLSAILAQVPAGGQVCACGPEPTRDAVPGAGTSVRSGSVRFERFAAAIDLRPGPNEIFEVGIGSTGAVRTVSADQTILGVLKDNGLHVDFGCSEGLCGSCITDVLQGEADHRDGVLSPEQQAENKFMCVCVSRAKSKRLVLDL